MDLTTGGVIVTDAIKYVQGRMDHLNTTEKKLLQDVKQKMDKEKKRISNSKNKKLPMGFSRKDHLAILISDGSLFF